MTGLSIQEKIKSKIRVIEDFPKPGISFKDITPILADPALCREIVHEFIEALGTHTFDAVAGIESRGFLFSMMLASQLNLPFIPIRKKGKLPWHTVEQEYELEYGTECIQIHSDAIKPGNRVLIHDDLLATGGTAIAASKLIQRMGAHVEAFAILISLDFLPGRENLIPYTTNIISLASFSS